MEQVIAPPSAKMPVIDYTIPHQDELEINGEAFIFKYRKLLPQKSEMEFEKFCKSIHEAGQWYPAIVTESGIVIDGNYRLYACYALGIEPKIYRVKDMPDAFEEWLVIELNTARRMMDSVVVDDLQRQRQRQLVHALYANGKGYTLQTIAEMLGLKNKEKARRRLNEAERDIQEGTLQPIEAPADNVESLSEVINQFREPEKRRPAKPSKQPTATVEEDEEEETPEEVPAPRASKRGRKRQGPSNEPPSITLLNGEKVTGAVADIAAANMLWTKEALTTIADLQDSCEEAFRDHAVHFPDCAKVRKYLKEIAMMIGSAALHSPCPECKMACRKTNGKICTYCHSLALVPKSKEK